jgi:hypothetical protein
MRIAPLVGITIIAWLLIIGEAYLFFEFILEFVPPLHVLGSFTVLSVLKILMTLGLVVVWYVVIVSITGAYVRSKVKSRPPTSSS